MLERSSRERLLFAAQAVALPLGFFLLLSAGLVLLWDHSHRSEANRLRVETRVVGELLRLRMETWLASRVGALQLLAAHVSSRDEFSPPFFRGVAARIMEQYPGFQAINWVDPEGTIRVVFPREGNEAALGQDLRRHPDPAVRASLRRAAATGKPTRTPVVDLFQGGRGFATYLPVVSRRNHRLLGFVNGVFRVDRVFDRWLSAGQVRDRFVLRVLEPSPSGPGERVVLGRPGRAGPASRRFGQRVRVRLLDRPWVLVVSPRPAHLAAVTSHADEWLLVASLLLALVASVLLGDLGRRHVLLRGRERRGRDLLDWVKTLHQVGTVEDLVLLAHEQVIRHFGPVGTWIWVAPEKGADGEGLLVGLPPGPGGPGEPVRSRCPCPSGTTATPVPGPRDARPRPSSDPRFPARLGYRSTSWQPLVVAGQRIGTFGIGCAERRDCLMDREGAALFRAIADQVAQVLSRILFLAARQRLEERLRHVQKLESLGVLAGGIAHDFNNLLVGILGNADLALLSLPPEARARQPIEGILRAGRRAADLCRQMLAYAGRGPMERRLVDLGQLVQEMIELLRASAGRNVSLELTFGEALPPVEGDPTQLRQVVLNLVTNAAEALEGRPGTVRVTVEAVGADDLPAGLRPGAGGARTGETLVRLRVADDGRGMDEEVRQRMFDPFFSTKRPGRGIGMAAVAGILRGHGAVIDVDSAPGRGTTVTAWFPATTGEVPDLPRAPAAGEERWRGEGVALVVDDEEPVREVGSRMLADLGYEVVAAGDGVEALAALEHHGGRVRVVLLDLTMPRMDGRECLARIRRRHPDLPVILTSGWEEGDPGDTPGPTVFLHKPWRRGDLVAALREVCPG